MMDTFWLPELELNRPRSSKDFLFQLDQQRQARRYTDVSVGLATGEALPCHKVVLWAGCPYFRAVLDHKPNAHDIDLTDLSPDPVKVLIQYLYTGKVSIDSSLVVDLLEAADFLQLPEVVEFCAVFLQAQLTADTCLLIEAVADRHFCKGLQGAAKRYILDNFSSVINAEHFLELQADRLINYLLDNTLNVQESELLTGICNWVSYDLARRGHYLNEMVCYINLKSIPSHITEYVLTPFPNIAKKVKEIRELPPKRLREVLILVQFQVTDIEPSNIRQISPKDNKEKLFSELPFIKRKKYTIDVANNNMYVCGGCSVDSEDTVYDEVWVYLNHYKNWRRGPSMRTARCDHGSAAINSLLFVVGGRGASLAEAEQYDMTVDQWTLLTNFASSCPVPELLRPCVVPLSDTLFIFGGKCLEAVQEERDTKRTLSHNRRAWCINSSTKSWQDAPGWLDAMARDSNFVGLEGPHCSLPYTGQILILDLMPSRHKGLYLLSPIRGLKCRLNVPVDIHRLKGTAILDNVLYILGANNRDYSNQNKLYSLDLKHLDAENGQSWNILPSPFQYLPNCHIVTVYTDSVNVQ